MKKVLSIIGQWIVILIYGVFASVRYIIKGEKLIWKAVWILLAAGLAALAVFWPFGLWIALGIYAAVSLVVTIWGMRLEEEKTETAEAERECGVFEGMSVQQAKSTYRALMKQYHPDNQHGNTLMAQKINSAYSNFQKTQIKV